MTLPLTLAQYGDLLLHFMLLSLLAIGGGITTAPDMHRYLVGQQGWLSDTQFTNSIALAQAAPGPNVLFVAVLGWNAAGPLGAFVTMLGIMLPSTTLVLLATRWAHDHRQTLGVRAFTAGMTPLTLGLLVATGWLLAQPYVGDPQHRWATLAAIGLTVLLAVKTRIGLVWLVLAGGVLGALGLI